MYLICMTKVTMNFSEEEVEIIARLRKDLGMSTNTSTVTQALRIACMMVQEAKAGHQMAIVREIDIHPCLKAQDSHIMRRHVCRRILQRAMSDPGSVERFLIA